MPRNKKNKSKVMTGTKTGGQQAQGQAQDPKPDVDQSTRKLIESLGFKDKVEDSREGNKKFLSTMFE